MQEEEEITWHVVKYTSYEVPLSMYVRRNVIRARIERYAITLSQKLFSEKCFVYILEKLK